MANYWVTFRIATGATYDKRYKGLIDALIAVRGQNASWGEPTSFWLVASILPIDQFISALSKPLDPNIDLLVIRELAVDDSRYFGTPAHPDVLRTFLPNIKKFG